FSENILQLRWRRRSEERLLLSPWMTKAKPLGMQKLPAQLGNFRTKFWVGNGLIAATAINLVAHYGMLNQGEMHSNLMCAPGLQFDIEQRKPIETLANAVNRKRRSAATNDRHPRAVAWIAGNWLIDPAGISFDLSVDQRHIRLKNFSRAKLIREAFMRAPSLRDDQQTGSAFVQTMDDAWPSFATGA